MVISLAAAAVARDAGFKVASEASPHTIPALVDAASRHFAEKP